MALELSGGRVEAGGSVEVARLRAGGDAPRHDDVRESMPGHVRLDPAPERPVADDDQARLRNPHAHRAISPQKVAEALALLEPADEEHVQAFVAQMPDRREAGPVDADVDAVGNHTPREV